MALKFIDEMDIQGKSVIARFDFNVPFSKERPLEIADTTRIDRSLETIQYILNHGAKKLVMMSHLGRPKGKVDSQYSLEPVAKYLAEKLEQDVLLTESCTDQGIKTLLTLNESKVLLLQNLRFHPEETNNDRNFAKILSSYGDIYVNDAFGAAHRKHASTYEINAFFNNRAVGGLLLKKEIASLEKVTKNHKNPFIAIVGGAKVSDKIKIIDSLLPKVSSLIIGGAMAYPFLKAQGKTIGQSLCSDEDVHLAKKILQTQNASKMLFPLDHLCSETFGGTPISCPTQDIPDHLMGLDIGPQTLGLFETQLREAKTVLWNGPMGLFENKDFSKGTFAIATILSELKEAFTLIGGGDSVSAVKLSGLSEQMSHISTGGGASLEFLEKGTLDGIQALRFGID